MNQPLPFHAWKAAQVDADSKAHGVHRFYRLREWYWRAYGTYCKKVGAR